MCRRVVSGMVIERCSLRVTDGDGVATDSLAGIDMMCLFYDAGHELKGPHNRVWVENPYSPLKGLKMAENG